MRMTVTCITSENSDSRKWLNGFVCTNISATHSLKVINHTFTITFVWTHAHSIHWHSLIHPWWWKHCRHLPHSPHSALIEMCLHVHRLGPGRQFRSVAAASSAPVRALLGCVAGCPVLSWSLVTGAGAETEMTNRTWWRTSLSFGQNRQTNLRH